MPTGRVLVVDTPGSALWALAARLRLAGVDVVEAADVDATRAGLSDEPDVVLVHLPVDGQVSSLLTAAVDAAAAPAIFGVAADESPGPVDPHVYLDTFVLSADPGTMARRIAREIERSGLRRQLRTFQRAAGPLLGPDAIVGDSAAMRQVRADVAKLAPVSVPVLVSGDSGTGRRHVARVLHDAGGSSDRPMVRFECAGQRGPARELFGTTAEPGAWAMAADTTLLIEAVDRLPLPVQARLADAVRDRLGPTPRAGARGAIPARIVATTAVNLDDRVRLGTFRGDLYYAIGVARVVLPPLRHRERDVLQLAACFLAQDGPARGVVERVLDDSVCEALLAHSWPGNVRELRDVVRLALTRSPGGRLTREALAIGLADRGDGPSFHLPENGVDLDALERQLVHEALARTGGNLTQAAALVGLSRDQVRYRLRKYGRPPGGAGDPDAPAASRQAE